MPPLTSTLRRARAHPVVFELPDGGGRVEIAPPSVAQIEACLRLDPDPDAAPPPETAAQEVIRRARQARILLGPAHEGLLDILQPVQVHEIVAALYIATSGMDAATYTRWQQAQRKAGIVHAAAELLENLEAMIIDLSAQLQKLPAEVGALPLADAVSLRERLAKLEKQHADTLATINGVKLEWG